MSESDARTPIAYAAESTFGESLAGKYMTFRLADEDYGIPILKVVQLIRLMRITRVPRTPSFVRGVINLRGKVLPVIDVRMKLDLGRVAETDHTVIVVVQHQIGENEFVMGLLVDEVLEVRRINAEEIAAAPGLGSLGGDASFILGVGNTPERVVFLLDIGRVLTTEEQRAISETRAQTAHEGVATA